MKLPTKLKALTLHSAVMLTAGIALGHHYARPVIVQHPMNVIERQQVPYPVPMALALPAHVKNNTAMFAAAIPASALTKPKGY